MPDDIEFLERIHLVMTSSKQQQEQLEKAIARADGDIIKMPVEAAALIQMLLSTQDVIVKGLVEENQAIKDRIEAVVARVNKQ